MTECEEEFCSNRSSHLSTRVFPCLYHCKKMLCIEHLSEHDKYIDKQIEFQKQLEVLWKNYCLLFNYEKIQKEFELLKNKIDNYQQLKEQINGLLSNHHFENSMENNQKIQTAIQTVQSAIKQENQSNLFPKLEFEMDDDDDDGQPVIDFASLSSSSTPNDDSLHNGNSPPTEQENECLQQINDSDDHDNEDDTMDDNSLHDETNVTHNHNIAASNIRGFCPLTQDGVFGINSNLHGIRLCSKKSPGNQPPYRLHAHFRRVHHLTPLASLALARAIGSGQDPTTTRLFNDHHIILNIEELRTVMCPMNKSLKNYPSLHIENSPCQAIKQVKHLRDHLRRVHKFTNKAVNIIVKAVRADVPVHMIEFPQWIDIIENDNHL